MIALALFTNKPCDICMSDSMVLLVDFIIGNYKGYVSSDNPLQL